MQKLLSQFIEEPPITGNFLEQVEASSRLSICDGIIRAKLKLIKGQTDSLRALEFVNLLIK